tara:strand:+ start:101 stop:451 length:351 start_codon:yes stop_codon:yes gene_type:complete
MSDSVTTIDELKRLIESFVSERDWEKFHSPKNLAMSISIEASELMEIFQWLDLDEAKDIIKPDTKERAEVLDEISDIVIYAIAFCNRNKIDLSDAIKQKMKKNIKKYPTYKCKGKL